MAQRRFGLANSGLARPRGTGWRVDAALLAEIQAETSYIAEQPVQLKINPYDTRRLIPERPLDAGNCRPGRCELE